MARRGLLAVPKRISNSSVNRCICLSLALRVAAFWKIKRVNAALDAAFCFAERGAIVCPLRVDAAILPNDLDFRGASQGSG
jgi:hypothetical protein